MKLQLISLLSIFLTISVFSQNKVYNVKKGAVANGYDVVAYFSNMAVKGTPKFSTTYDGVSFRFYSEQNLQTFKKNPKKYIPQYGGYCAYAIGKMNGKKVGINPKTYEIRDGKLYLFYNSWGTNTLKSWLKDNPEELRKKADENWSKIVR